MSSMPWRETPINLGNKECGTSTCRTSSAAMLSAQPTLHQRSTMQHAAAAVRCGPSTAHAQLLLSSRLTAQYLSHKAELCSKVRAPSNRRSLSVTRAGRSSGGKKVAEKLARTWGLNAPIKSAPKNSKPQNASLARRKSSSSSDNNNDDDDEPRWGIFNLSAYNRSDFGVPWGAWRTLGGISLWFGSFIAVGFLVLPGVYRLAGIDIFALSAQERANFTLTCQAVEVVMTAAILWALTRKPLAEQPAPLLFNFDPRAPFTKPYGWAVWALLGIIASPITVGSVARLLSLFSYEESVGGRGTVDGVATMIQMDIPTYLDLLGTTGVLAPIMEEAVFRGFLLTSLTKFMPTWAAVVASSAAFGLAHLSARDLPVLTALGILLGFSYVRSRNLLTPILIHGAWNSTVLTLLFVLVYSGIDVQQMLSDLK